MEPTFEFGDDADQAAATAAATRPRERDRAVLRPLSAPTPLVRCRDKLRGRLRGCCCSPTARGVVAKVAIVLGGGQDKHTPAVGKMDGGEQSKRELRGARYGAEERSQEQKMSWELRIAHISFPTHCGVAHAAALPHCPPIARRRPLDATVRALTVVSGTGHTAPPRSPAPIHVVSCIPLCTVAPIPGWRARIIRTRRSSSSRYFQPKRTAEAAHGEGRRDNDEKGERLKKRDIEDYKGEEGAPVNTNARSKAQEREGSAARK
jgi:hypothetical protein